MHTRVADSRACSTSYATSSLHSISKRATSASSEHRVLLWTADARRTQLARSSTRCTQDRTPREAARATVAGCSHAVLSAQAPAFETNTATTTRNGRHDQFLAAPAMDKLKEAWRPGRSPIRRATLPKHVAVVMDGNFRWAQQNGLDAAAGHAAGRQPLSMLIACCCDWGIPALTVYAFSSENWQRSSSEVSFLLSLFEGVLQQELPELQCRGVRLLIAGDKSKLPSGLRSDLERAEQLTAANDSLFLTVAISYGARQDIVAAARKLATSVQQGSLQPNAITEEVFESCLSTAPVLAAIGPPDLLIRTSGEQRLSNFLLWELAYAELHFMEACWPDVDEAAFSRALTDYAKRKRRFGRRA